MGSLACVYFAFTSCIISYAARIIISLHFSPVYPYAPRKFIHAFHGLGTNFTLPCGVTIGDISRQMRHRVQWLLYMVPPAPGAVHTRLFLYDSSQDDSSMMEFDGMYQFNPSNQNFSLHVTDFAVDTVSLQQHVVYYECTVTTDIRGSSFLGTATTNVTFEFGMYLQH